MFQEDIAALDQAEKSNRIPNGLYEATITGVRSTEAKKAGGHGQFIIEWTIADGEYELSEYVQFLTKSPNAAGVRAGFYNAIGYVRPEDGQIDENEWIGHNGEVAVVNEGGQVKVSRVNKSKRATESTEDASDGNGF